MIFDPRYSLCDVKQVKVVSQEHKNEHILYNKSQVPVYQFRVDGDIVKDHKKKRCDFIVEVQNAPKAHAYIIELKGSDLNRAIDQIVETIEAYREALVGYKIFPRVIIHKVVTHDIQGKKCRDIRRKYPETVIKTRTYSDHI